MKLELHTVSRDDLFDAKAVYDDGKVTVLKGSRINMGFSDAFKPSSLVMSAINNREIVNDEGVLIKEITFDSLSTAATFVAGRVSNGMITWKTADGKYVRETLQNKKGGAKK